MKPNLLKSIPTMWAAQDTMLEIPTIRKDGWSWAYLWAMDPFRYIGMHFIGCLICNVGAGTNKYTIR